MCLFYIHLRHHRLSQYYLHHRRQHRQQQQCTQRDKELTG
jgi:hypothetical protein